MRHGSTAATQCDGLTENESERVRVMGDNCRCAKAGPPRCPCCFDNLGRGKAVFTAPCGHSYHYACVQKRHLDGQGECMLCNEPFKEPPVLLISTSCALHQGCMQRRLACFRH